MTSENITDDDVHATAAHILVLIDAMQEQMKAIKASAERLMRKEVNDAAHP